MKTFFIVTSPFISNLNFLVECQFKFQGMILYPIIQLDSTLPFIGCLLLLRFYFTSCVILINQIDNVNFASNNATWEYCYLLSAAYYFYFPIYIVNLLICRCVDVGLKWGVEVIVIVRHHQGIIEAAGIEVLSQGVAMEAVAVMVLLVSWSATFDMIVGMYWWKHMVSSQ